MGKWFYQRQSIIFSNAFNILAFELLEKGEILEMPAENPLSEEAAWTCFRDVVHGLEYLVLFVRIFKDISNLLFIFKQFSHNENLNFAGIFQY